MNNKTIIKTNKLCKSFKAGGQEQEVLKKLDIEIYDKDFTVIMGASGAGKSTLLYALSGMDAPTSGKIKFFEADIAHMTNDKLAVFRRNNCGFVFQQMFLLDNMSIMDNILASGYLVNKNRKKIVETAKELLKEVDLKEIIWKKFPSQLSGGENQRAAIVRALINQPKVVFADEPTGALNSASGIAVLDVLTGINRQGQNIIMVTHDIHSALRGNRILYIQDGAICGELILDKYEAPDKERYNQVKNFLTNMGW